MSQDVFFKTLPCGDRNSHCTSINALILIEMRYTAIIIKIAPRKRTTAPFIDILHSHPKQDPSSITAADLDWLGVDLLIVGTYKRTDFPKKTESLFLLRLNK